MSAGRTTEVRFPADLDLRRFPDDPRDPLRAWDASDDYLLRHLDEAKADLAGTVVVAGDRWGALATALGPFGVTQVSDSFLGQQATRRNLARNEVPEDGVRLLTSVDLEDAAQVPERVDVLVVRVPKSLALLEDQLRRLAPALHPESVVVGTGMVTEIHTSTLELFTGIVGPTRTSLAVRKARLVFSAPDTSIAPAPHRWPLRYALPTGIGVLSGRPVVNHAGTFSADHLDIGTRFFLGHLPARTDDAHIVDLGCGNGVVGVAAALLSPRARLTFLDESYPALASARATFAANLDPAAREARFVAADGLDGTPDGSADLVLTNPPFHTHQATTDATAWRMFTGARRVLRRGGELWVVGNRHLGYHVKLKRIFGNCDVVAGNPKFVVLRSVR